MRTDEIYMRRCLQLARNGEYYVAPNPMVGAVLVSKDGAIVGEGWHEQYGGPHAEVNCFRDAEKRGARIVGTEPDRYRDCTLYVSLEPCSHYGKTPPCANLIVEKGVGKVVVGCMDPNPKVSGRGVAILREAGIEVETGVLEAECRELNKRFLCLQEKKRPYVIVKWAQTEDGFLDGFREIPKAGMAKTEPLQISTEETKKLVHKMRAENMAILVGSNTALLDDPHLTTKHWPGRNPARILLDRRGRVPKTARIFSPDAETIVYRENTDWEFVLSDLGRRGIHSLIVEGGSKVLETVLSSGIYDEIHVEVAPIQIGEGVAAPKIRTIGKIEKYAENHYFITYSAGPRA